MNEIEQEKMSESRRSFIAAPAKILPAVAIAGAGLAPIMSAQAQTLAAVPGGTGDMIEGTPVITELYVDKLNPGRHQFWFRGASSGIGQYWYVPVIVVKGKNPGKSLGLQAGTHGDELNGIKVIQELTASLDPEKMSGAIVAVPGANITGLLAHNRNWQLGADGGYTIDFNRVWPGKEKGNVAEQHAWLLFNKLWRNNINYFVDLHTQSRGTVYPLFIYVDDRNAGAKEMAHLVPADQIKYDEGERTTTEQEFNEIGISSITLEIGAPKVYQHELIARSIVGMKNIMSYYKIIPDPIGQTSKEAGTYFGKEMTSIRAEVGGFADILVKLGDMVTKDQLVAVQRDPFGKIIREYNAPVAGKVLSIGTDPIRESRSLLVRILY